MESVTGEKIVRPSPLQWLRYVYTGSVPAKNHAWVLYDATCRTWVLRHAARYVALVAPLVIVTLFLPTTLYIRLGIIWSAGASVLIGYLCFTTESLERRVEKAGYPYGLAGRMREERALKAQNAVAARNRARREERWVQRHSA